jgi:hypothetical protein
MSGVESSPWGLAEFGFPQFAAASPSNTVVALAAYWVDRTAKMLAFERLWPEQCLRVRYEDLVTKTDEVLDGVWDFIGVPRAPGAATAAFEQKHDTSGRADHKVWWTRSVHNGSIGSGARVPAELVTGLVAKNMNDLLGLLDYGSVGIGWGSGTPPAVFPVGSGDRPSEVGEAALVELRVVDGHDVLGRGIVDLATSAWVETYGDNAPAGRAPQQVSRVVAAERFALAEICAGTLNIGAALRARTVRYYGPPLLDYEDELEIFERLIDFLVAAVGVAAPPA